MKTVGRIYILLVILCTAFLIVSCSVKADREDSFLTGNWIMCGDECDGVQTMRNVCTYFRFEASGRGKITYPGYVSGFSYRLEKNKIVFSFSSEYDRDNFISKDSVFDFTRIDEGPVNLILKEKNGCEFYLGDQP